MTGRGDYAVHRFSPSAIHLDGDRAPAELPLIIEWRVDINGVEADLALACRSQYRAPRGNDDVWRITRTTSIYEKDISPPSCPTSASASTRTNLRPPASPARCLAWYLNRNGHQVGPDHLGDAQPNAVQRQYRAEMTWPHKIRTPAVTAGNRKEQQ